MNARLIVNPVAGRDAAPSYLEMLNAKLRGHFGEMDLILTISPGDAKNAAAEAVQFGCSYIFIAGGDGTVNEAVNGVASVKDGLHAVTFGIIPLGTGNDFATGLGMPLDVEHALEALIAGHEAVVDLGTLNGLCFVNVSAGGFLAEVSEAVNPQLKSIAGRLAYLIGGAQVLFDAVPVRARISAETQWGAKTLDLELLTFAVCNSRMIGGGRLIAPDALVNDGWLDVCLVRDMPRGEFVRLLAAVSRGEHLNDERVEYFRARELTFDFDKAIKMNTDGEVIEAARCEYQVLPQVARVLTGADPMTLVSGV
jgi:diacylglycerol kinase (ATP)